MMYPQRFFLFLIAAFLLVQGCTTGGQEGSDTGAVIDTDTDTSSDSDTDTGFLCGATEICNLAEYCLVTTGGTGNTTYACTPLPNACVGDETCLCLEPVCDDVGGSCTDVDGLTCEIAMP